MELGEFMTQVFAGQSLDPKFKVQPFQINDPRSMYDYKKLDWAAPGYTSLKQQVQDTICYDKKCPTGSIRAK